MSHRLSAALLLGLYSILIAQLTLADPSSGHWAFSLADHLATSASDGRLTWTRTEVLANVALFVPAGFLLTVVLGRPVVAAALCVAASVCIELVQYRYLPSRVPSVADVEHNALGGMIGAVLAWPVLSRPALALRP